MKKSHKTGARRAAVLRKERKALESELEMLPLVASLTFISPALLARLEGGAAEYRVPLEMFACHYVAFHGALLQQRIQLINAQLDAGPPH